MKRQRKERTGIKTVPHALLKNESEYAYITKRVDRIIDGEKASFYAMEDFCQLSGRLTRDKYRGSYENCARIICRYSSRPGLDLSELFLRVVFSFVIGNSDMHLKNFSLREQNPAGRDYFLAETYDMLPVNLILPDDEEEMALTLNGKKRNIRRKDFLEFGNHCGLTEKTAVKLIRRICSLQDKYEKACTQSCLQDKQIEAMMDLIGQRIRRLV